MAKQASCVILVMSDFKKAWYGEVGREYNPLMTLI